MGKIFFVCGKSCSGKDTLFKYLSNDSSLNLKTVVGYTTRPMRDGEENGREYFFVDEKRMLELKKSGRVIELRTYDTIHGKWHYFTVDDGQINLAENDYIYIGTLESYTGMVNYYGKNNIVPIYIQVETGVRLERAVKREKQQPSPKYTEMCRRFIADEEDFSEEKLAIAGIVKRYDNDILDECLSKIVYDIKNQEQV